MIEYIEIIHEGSTFTIPKRDDIDDWRMWISLWLNEGCLPEQVQNSVNKAIESDTIKIREKGLENLLNE